MLVLPSVDTNIEEICFIGTVMLAFAIRGRISLIASVASTTSELLFISYSLPFSSSVFATIGTKANLVLSKISSALLNIESFSNTSKLLFII